MLKPGTVVEVRRDSKRTRAEQLAAFAQRLTAHIPHAGAVARLEVTDSRGHTTQLARYLGRTTATHKITCDPLAGVWTLEEWRDAGAGSADDGLPDFVHAGRHPEAM